MEPEWNDCGSVIAHSAVSDWLRERGLDPRAVAARDLARADPQHLILPLFASDGRIGRLHKVPVAPGKRRTRTPGARGSVPPLQAQGLVMANLVGRALLLVGDAPAWWTWRTVLIVDDLIEFLSWGSSYADFEDIPALFFLPAAGWTPNHACRIPAGTRVIVRTGNHHVPMLLNQLQERCEVVVRR